MERILFIIFILLLSVPTKGQSIEVETEKFPGVKTLEVKSFNSCCAKKGYRAVYFFDKSGQAIESSNFFRRKLLAKYKYSYNNKALLTEKIQVYSINDKTRIDTTSFSYRFDTQGRLIKKSEKTERWASTETYQDFDTNNFPQTVVSTFGDRTTIFRKEYSPSGKEIRKQRIENDSTIALEENKYNPSGEIIYSILPAVVAGKAADGKALFMGSNRHSAIEEYAYTYDRLGRWTKKYVIYDGKKVLLQKRIYK